MTEKRNINLTIADIPLRLNITASGGVSSMEDVEALAAMDLYGAIIGKAYYTGDIILSDAIRAAGPQE